MDSGYQIGAKPEVFNLLQYPIFAKKKRVNDSTRIQETNTILHIDLVTKKLDSQKYALHMYTPVLVNKVNAEYHKRIYLTADNMAWNVSVTNMLLTSSSI